MDNFMESLTFVIVALLGVLVVRLQAEVKETRKLLDEVIELSRRTNNNHSNLSDD
jgi:hypothetical protein